MTIGSLFAGIGGLELGIEAAGLGPVRWQVEIDPFCRRVLAKHWPDAVRLEDVRAVGKSTLAPVDVICGGFPCQDVSSAGKGAGLEGARSGLWREYRRIVAELTPPSSSSKTFRAAKAGGCLRCGRTCTCLVTTRWPWIWAQSMSAHRTAAGGSLLWPTPTATANLLAPSMAKWPTHARLQALLPTPSATAYGSNKGGAAGRVGKERPSLHAMASGGLLPSRAKKHGGSDLPGALGQTTRCLNPRFVEWMMGFPPGWCDVSSDDETPSSKPSATPSSRSRRTRSGAGSGKTGG